jgi:hypothetical protein
MRRQQKPAMDGRLAGRLREKKALLDRYRPLPASTVVRLNEDLKVLSTYHSNAIEGNTLSLHETQMVVEYGMTVGGHSLREYHLDLYLEACATTATPEEEDYLPLSELAREFGYDPEYLSWLARYSRLEALKRGRRWYARRRAVEQYRREAEQHTQEQRTAAHSKD